MAQAHYSYVQKIPEVIKEFIKESNRVHLSEEQIEQPIGGKSVIHSHNTFPSVAQSLNCPMWEVPDVYSELNRNNREWLENREIEPINQGSYGRYRETKERYIAFANSLIERLNNL